MKVEPVEGHLFLFLELENMAGHTAGDPLECYSVRDILLWIYIDDAEVE